LRVDALRFLRRGGDDGEGADALAVETLEWVLVYVVVWELDLFVHTMFLAKDWAKQGW
jgi:hypothetical protein